MKKNIVYGVIFLCCMMAGIFSFSIYYQETYVKINPKLISVSIDNDYWTSQDVTVTVDYLNKNIDISQYSFDGGKNWQNSNQYTVSENQELEIVLKTGNGRKSEVVPYKVRNIDKTAPQFVLEDKIYIERNSAFSINDYYQIVETGSGLKGNISISPNRFNTSAIRSYEVEFKATDRALNSTNRKMIIEIVESGDPHLGEEEEVPVKGLTLSDNRLNLVVGTSIQVKAQVKPENATNKKVTWTSSNEEVATVSEDGTIKALSRGLATITATTEDGNMKSDIRVVVTNTEVLATEITLDKTSGKATTDSPNIVLTATIGPDNATNRTIRWTSSDTNIATVTDGVVSIRGEGTVVITATTSNGKKATYTLVVQDVYTFSVKEVTVGNELMGYTVKIYKNGNDITQQVTAITEPFTARNTLKASEIEISINNHSQLKDTITFNYNNRKYTATR